MQIRKYLKVLAGKAGAHGAYVAALCAGFSAAWLAAGCESADSHGVEISASRRDFTAKGQTAVLTASGWNGYKWTISDKSIGRLSDTTGRSVTYTALVMPAAGESYKNQTITCQTTDSGDGGGAFGTITLRHVSSGGSATQSASTNNASSGSGSSTAQPLVISPTSHSVSRAGQTFSLSVVSPIGHSYSWNVVQTGMSTGDDPTFVDLGRISPTSGTQTTYVAPSLLPSRGQTATIQCTDTTTGKSAICTVTFN